MTHPINTGEVETAIDGLAAKVSVSDLDDLLGAVQEDVEDFWDEHMTAVEAGDLELVTEDEEALVFADQNGQFWRTQFDAVVEYIDLIGAEQEGTPEAVLAAHHNAAYRLADYNWSTSNPVVVAKPADFDCAQRFVEAVVNNLMARGLSPGQAWAHYGVVIRGSSRNSWAERCGYSDHSAVSEAVRKAKDKLAG